jgi:flagellar hook assembly protein FlgD
LKAGVLHHTVNANSYSRRQAAGLVRGIYAYHVKSNGWNDIGYNFLVDRFGRTYEGRYGGVTRNVIGAHTLGFNTSTFGVALIGTFSSRTPSRAARSAVQRLVSWRLDLAHVNPAGYARLTSGGNASHPAGQTITRRALSGHRDFMGTECPGRLAYRTINRLRSNAWHMGGPKFTSPRASYTTDGAGNVTGITVKAHANERLAYTLTLHRSSDDAVIATIHQTATDATIVWNGASPLSPVPVDDVEWQLDGVRGSAHATPYRTMLMGGPPRVRLQATAPVTPLVTPNGDGLSDVLSQGFRINTQAAITVQIVDQADHASVVRQVWTNRQRDAGRYVFAWGGMLANGAAAPNGLYTLIVSADDPVAAHPDPAPLQFDFTLDRTLALAAVRTPISPNGNGVRDTSTITVTTAGGPTNVDLTIRTDVGGAVRRTLLVSTPVDGASRHLFDGRDDATMLLPDGTYTVQADATGSTGTPLTLTRSLVIDTTPPSGTARRRRDGLVKLRTNERTLVSGMQRLSNGSRRARHIWINPGRTYVVSRFRGARKLTYADVAGNAVRISVRSA